MYDCEDTDIIKYSNVMLIFMTTKQGWMHIYTTLHITYGQKDSGYLSFLASRRHTSHHISNMPICSASQYDFIFFKRRNYDPNHRPYEIFGDTLHLYWHDRILICHSVIITY